MRSLILCGVLSVAAAVSAAPNVTDLHRISPPEKLENIHVQPLATDKHSSQFLIFVKSNVKPHIHKLHSETIYVLEGEGVMRVGSREVAIKPGHFIQVPANTVHGLKVTSAKPLKALSVQAPEFFGKDRVFVDD